MSVRDFLGRWPRLILWGAIVLAVLALAEGRPESLAGLHWLEMIRGGP